jgi:ABC-type enterochelin transport system substrate-binding protein
MFNHIRTLFIALFMGLFLIACGDNNNSNDEATSETSSAENGVTTDVTTTADETVTDADADSVIGMTEEEVISKWGEPALTQTHNLDAMKITHHEWNTEDGVVAVQFHDGVAKFSQTIPAE